MESLPAYIVTVKGVEYLFVFKDGSLTGLAADGGNEADFGYAYRLVKKEAKVG